MKYYKKEDVLKKLKGFVYSEYGSMKDYAEYLGSVVLRLILVRRSDKPVMVVLYSQVRQNHLAQELEIYTWQRPMRAAPLTRRNAPF